MRSASSGSPRLGFPHGRHFALTWGIADRYGGMTGAMLHRSRAFVRLAGVDVTVLTLDDRADYPELEQRMRTSGELVDGLSIRNLWDDLRQRPVAPQNTRPEADALLVPMEGDTVAEHAGIVLLRERRDAKGSLIGTDRFRRDGTLLATDRVVDGHRRIVAYDEHGAPLRTWGSSWKLYAWWLDRLTRRGTNFLIVDSKTAARFAAGYRRDNVVTVHLVHGAHRKGERAGVLRPSRARVLRRAADFDAVVVLTERQRADMRADGVAEGARVRVIPNGIDLDPPAEREHVRGTGVVIASLTARKRVEHAAQAVAVAASRSNAVRLDVYGEGEQESALRARIAKDEAEDRIALHGFRTDARERFTEADFSLLTSTSEGLPLVLAESMAAGCIPIAYDIPYGPSDVIRDGIDGFVVPAGDVAAIADRILALQQMPQAQVAAMRHRARVRAAMFADRTVTRVWGRELGAALDAKRLRAVEWKPLRVRMRRRLGILRRRLGIARRRLGIIGTRSE
ncbi:hypothetical protein GCM10025768_12900 [Microbacterium pseudoresistens]|uniref:Poly(Glycerol-phosphate) alpha-glucosyltransferase n=1 Tax=Microbacterium pseudoresistens TaxID=640634 RepID=A0A7Y9JP35_9MICO|nr:glycosyltransferase [Microbacterium pseudoresistens]NYD55193.1 poly(glycerol-phosphate) alpha-glucosyltransferase [Microbacterium pseudoresistens]